MPYPRDTDVAVIYAHLSEEPPKPSALRPDLPEGLDARDRQGAREVARPALCDLRRPDGRRARRDRRRRPAVGDARRARTPIASRRGERSAGDRRRDRVGAPAPPRPTGARACCSPARTPTRARSRGWRSATASTSRRRRAPKRSSSAARDLRPDLVIVDWDAPGAAGRRGRAARRRRHARRQAAAAGRPRAQAAHREVAAAGADERLASPFSPLQLQVKLRKLLGAEAVTGHLGPDEGSRVLVPGLDPGADVGVEFADGAVRAAPEQLGGELGEPALDEVQPRRAGGREVQEEARVCGQPALDRRRLVGDAVVEHEVDVELGWGPRGRSCAGTS